METNKFGTLKRKRTVIDDITESFASEINSSLEEMSSMGNAFGFGIDSVTGMRDETDDLLAWSARLLCNLLSKDCAKNSSSPVGNPNDSKRTSLLADTVPLGRVITNIEDDDSNTVCYEYNEKEFTEAGEGKSTSIGVGERSGDIFSGDLESDLSFNILDQIGDDFPIEMNMNDFDDLGSDIFEESEVDKVNWSDLLSDPLLGSFSPRDGGLESRDEETTVLDEQTIYDYVHQNPELMDLFHELQDYIHEEIEVEERVAEVNIPGRDIVDETVHLGKVYDHMRELRTTLGSLSASELELNKGVIKKVDESLVSFKREIKREDNRNVPGPSRENFEAVADDSPVPRKKMKTTNMSVINHLDKIIDREKTMLEEGIRDFNEMKKKLCRAPMPDNPRTVKNILRKRANRTVPGVFGRRHYAFRIAALERNIDDPP